MRIALVAQWKIWQSTVPSYNYFHFSSQLWLPYGHSYIKAIVDWSKSASGAGEFVAIIMTDTVLEARLKVSSIYSVHQFIPVYLTPHYLNALSKCQCEQAFTINLYRFMSVRKDKSNIFYGLYYRVLFRLCLECRQISMQLNGSCYRVLAC